MTLEGDWLFYRSQLLSPKDLPTAQGGQLFSVPQAWKWSEQPSPAYGYGTYLLRVENIGLKQPVLKLPIIGSAYRLYVNGELVSQAGKVGFTPETTQGAWKPGLVWLPAAPDGRWEILIQVSNFEDITGGVAVSPTLGEAWSMTDENRRQLIQESFFFGALLLIGIYHLGLFFFRMKDASPLWFGLITLCISSRILVDNNHLIIQLFPETSWFLVLKWGYLTLSLAVFLFPQFMAVIFPKQSWKPSLRILQSLALLYSLVILFTPPSFFSSLLSTFHLVLFLACIDIFVVLFKALRDGAPGAWIFLTGFLVVFIAVLHDVIEIYIPSPLPPLVPSGMLIFLLFQALVMARKFTGAFTAAENFSAYLKKMNLSLERFIPREVLSYLKKDSIMDVNLGDHIEMEMTILFSDIRDFTGLSEKMTPKENFNFINSYLNRMGPIIRKHGGFVDKYMGDGIMALFPGNPQQALEAAMEMRTELVKYNEDRKKVAYRPIRIGVGLHTGLLMVGTIGEEGRMDSTVISDAVNMASRMEGLTKVFHEDILVSSSLVLAMPEDQRNRFRFLGDETVKGKTESVGVYGV